MSQQPLSIDPAIVQALTELVKTRAPKNRPMTLAEVEQAVFDLLRQLGTEVTAETMTAQVAQAEKRGPGRSVAGKTCVGSVSDAGC